MPRAAKKAVKKTARGRRSKSASVETEPEVQKPAPKPPMALQQFDPEYPDPLDEVAKPDFNLTEEQKKEFAAILNEKLDIRARADLLVKLAKRNDTKTAAVGLRAIQIINELTGVTAETAVEAPPMFKMPDSATEPSIKVVVEEK